MPLTKRQFELGTNEDFEGWMLQVYRVLLEHRHLAYSYEELLQIVLGDSQPYANLESFDHVLGVLLQVGAVEKCHIDGTDYYAISQG